MKVAVAVIIDSQDRILITRRSESNSHGGFWEFPGGKLEINEKATDALIREVKEEVGLDVIDYDFLGNVETNNSQVSIELQVYLIRQFHGEASCCESQMDLKWVKFDELKTFKFPKANNRIIELIANTIISI